MAAGALAAFGGFLGGIGSIYSDRAKSEQYTAYAAANDYNSMILRQRADQSRGVFATREDQQRAVARIAQGESRAAAAESGTGVNTGTNAQLLHQNAVMSELDSLNIRYEGVLQARDFDIEAHQQDAQAQLNKNNASTIRSHSLFNAFSAFFGQGGAQGFASSGGYGGTGGGTRIGSRANMSSWGES